VFELPKMKLYICKLIESEAVISSNYRITATALHDDLPNNRRRK